MALTINTNIKNDADGYLLDADAVKVREGVMLDDELADIAEEISAKQDSAAVKSVIDTPLQTNTIYNLGTLTDDLTLTLPTNAGDGELIYVSFDDDGYEVEVIGTLISPIVRRANCFNELMFLRVGSAWSAVYRGSQR